MTQQKWERRSLDNPTFVRRVLRYGRTGLESADSDWAGVRGVITTNWPEVSFLGDKLITRIQSLGRTTRKQRKKSFKYLQHELGLKGNVSIGNPEPGRQNR